jgi:excisionase family DNA binding protein
MSTQTAQKAYSRQDAAALYGVSLSTIEKAIRKGELRVKMVGRSYRISAEALAEWFEGLPDG